MAQEGTVPKPKRTTNKSALEKVEKEFPKLSQSRQKVLARKIALLDKLKVLPLAPLQ
jgi:hypothetical protein